MSVDGVRWALRQSVGDRQKVILAAIALAADDRDVTFASQKALALAVSRTDRTVRSVLASLGKDGLVTRFRRHRENGSRTTDLIVLGLPREEPLDLSMYSGIVGEREPADSVAPGSGLDRPTGKHASGGATGKHASGPDPLKASSKASKEKGGSGGDQTALDVPEARVTAFVEWHGKRLVERGLRAPSSSPAVRKAARDLLARATGDELRGMYLFAACRTFWASKVATLPKWRQHYDALRLEWLASQESAARVERNGRHERPEVPAGVSTSYDGDRVEIS